MPESEKQAVKTAAGHALAWETDRIGVQSICFAPDFIAFQGHFPGHPLLPACARIQMTQVMLETAWQAPLQLERLDKAKFREPLRPGPTVTVRCHPEEISNTRQAVGIDLSDDGPNHRTPIRLIPSYRFRQGKSALCGQAIMLAILRGA